MSSILRVSKIGNYFAASNVPFNDKRLSWEARGIMGYLLSKPDSWTISVVDLIRQSPAGLRVVRRVLKELQKHGYIERQRLRIDGKFQWLSTVHEIPIGTFCADGDCTDSNRVDLISTELAITKPNKKEYTLSRGSPARLRAKQPKNYNSHPAIQAVYKVAGFYPHKAIHQEIINGIGENPNIPNMEAAFKTWVANGFEERNVKGWLLDWYKEGMHYVLPSQRLAEAQEGV